MSSTPIQESPSPVLRERTEDTNFAAQACGRLTAHEAELAVRQTCPSYIHFYTLNRIISSPNVSVKRAWMQKVDTSVVVINGKEKDVERVKIQLEVVIEPKGTTLEIIDCSSDVPAYHQRRHQHTGKRVSLDARTYPSFETARTVANTRPPVETQGSLLRVLKVATAAHYFTPASWTKLSPSESAELHKARDKLCGPKEEAKVRKLKPWAWHSPGVFSERRKIGGLVKLEGPLVRLGICRTEEQYYKDEAHKRIVERRKEAEGEKEEERKKESGEKEDDSEKTEESEKQEGGKKEEDSETAEDSEKDEKCEKVKVWWKVEKWTKAEKGAKVEKSRKVADCSKGTHGQKSQVV